VTNPVRVLATSRGGGSLSESTAPHGLAARWALATPALCRRPWSTSRSTWPCTPSRASSCASAASSAPTSPRIHRSSTQWCDCASESGHAGAPQRCSRNCLPTDKTVLHDLPKYSLTEIVRVLCPQIVICLAEYTARARNGDGLTTCAPRRAREVWRPCRARPHALEPPMAR